MKISTAIDNTAVRLESKHTILIANPFLRSDILPPLLGEMRPRLPEGVAEIEPITRLAVPREAGVLAGDSC